jgi:urease accessory protein
MKTRLGFLVSAGFLWMTGGASAHSVFVITGFTGGLLHPLVVLTQFAAVTALALLIGQQGWPSRVLLVFAAGLIVGLGVIALAYVPTYVEQMLLALAAMTGALIALARPLPWPVGAALAAVTGLAVGLDSPPEAISVAEANLTLLGTALSATALLNVLAWLASRLRRDWQRIGMRIAGSWIAASAVMVLALRVAGD